MLQQTRQDFEIFIVGDGAPDRTREIAEALHARDPRIHYFSFEKGPRHGEGHRDTVITKTSADFVCYLADDDLWFPDHLETMGDLLRHADLAHTMQAELEPGGKVSTWMFDAEADPLGRERMRRSETGFGLASGGHTLAAYRRLPRGWHPAPIGINSDLFFWLLFLDQSWCRYASFKWPTVVHLSSVMRRNWPPASRVAELSAIAPLIQDAAKRSRMIRDALQPCLDKTLRDSFGADQAIAQARAAELSRVELRSLLPRYSLGEQLTFGRTGEALRFLAHGLTRDDWGSWTSSERAGLTIPVVDGAAGDLRLAVAIRHMLNAPRHPSSTFSIAANGETIFATTESQSGPVYYEIMIPESVYREVGCIALEFLAQLHSPLELGINSDTRRIGVGLISLRLDRGS